MRGLGKTTVLVVFVVLVAWGAFVRLWDLGGRPFWQDEAWVATALRDHSYGELFRQTELPMPPLFAAAAKLAGGLRAAPEAAMRILPAAFGIALLPLIYLAARTLRASRVLALAVLALCASSYMLVVWSRELKQYQIEAFFAVLSALLVFRIRRGPASRNPWPEGVALLLVCIVAPWFGYGVVFVFAPLLAALVLLRPTERRRLPVAAWGLAGAVGAALSLAALMACAAADQLSNEALSAFWRCRYIDPTDWFSWAKALGRLSAGTFWMVLPQDYVPRPELQAVCGLFVCALAALGLFTWPRRARLDLVLWGLVPILLVVAAGVAQRYPVGPARFIVFWSPALVLLVAAGIVRVCRFVASAIWDRRGPGMIFGLVLTILPAACIASLPLRQVYWVYHDFPAVLRVLDEQRRPGELVLVSIDAVPAVRFYAHGDTSSFVYYPTAAGTLRVPDFDYHQFTHDVLSRAGRCWWLLRVYPSAEPVLIDLLQQCAQRSYRLEVITQAGEDHPFGRAQLCRLTWR